MQLDRKYLPFVFAVVLWAGGARAQHLAGRIDYWDTRPLRPYGCVVVGETPWFTTNDGYVFTIDPADGSTTSYDSMLDPVFFGQVVAAPDGTLWIADGKDRLVHFDPAGPTFTAHPVPHVTPPFGDPAGPSGVALATDGSVWCTMEEDRSLGRYVPATDTWERHLLPGPTGGPFAHLTFAPDQTIWFTIKSQGPTKPPGLGHYDPAGPTWQTWTIPAPYAGATTPFGIVFDSGLVWFLDHHGSKLVRFVPPGGPFTAYDTPSVFPLVDDPHFLVPGPDGVLFFTGFGTSKIFAFDPATESFDSRALVLGAQPMGIDRTDSGVLWWAQTGAQGSDFAYPGAGVGRLTPADLDAPVPAPALTFGSLAVALAVMACAGLLGIWRRRLQG
jgi:streptogramin lyase